MTINEAIDTLSEKANDMLNILKLQLQINRRKNVDGGISARQESNERVYREKFLETTFKNLENLDYKKKKALISFYNYLGNIDNFIQQTFYKTAYNTSLIQINNYNVRKRRSR